MRVPSEGSAIPCSQFMTVLIWTPIFSMAWDARSSISFRSSVSILSEKISEITLCFLDSLFKRMFSVAVNPGIRENS